MGLPDLGGKSDFGGTSLAVGLETFKNSYKYTNRANTIEKAERNEINFSELSLLY